MVRADCQRTSATGCYNIRCASDAQLSMPPSFLDERFLTNTIAITRRPTAGHDNDEQATAAITEQNQKKPKTKKITRKAVQNIDAFVKDRQTLRSTTT